MYWLHFSFNLYLSTFLTQDDTPVLHDLCTKNTDGKKKIVRFVFENVMLCLSYTLISQSFSRVWNITSESNSACTLPRLDLAVLSL